MFLNIKLSNAKSTFSFEIFFECPPLPVSLINFKKICMGIIMSLPYMTLNVSISIIIIIIIIIIITTFV